MWLEIRKIELKYHELFDTQKEIIEELEEENRALKAEVELLKSKMGKEFVKNEYIKKEEIWEKLKEIL